MTGTQASSQQSETSPQSSPGGISLYYCPETCAVTYMRCIKGIPQGKSSSQPVGRIMIMMPALVMEEVSVASLQLATCAKTH